MKGENMNSDKKKTLLLVEDEALIAIAQKTSLEKQDYWVITATSGKKAIALFRENLSIDLVLMDIDLGTGMDGTQTAAEILAIRAVPVVFLSSHSEPSVVGKTDLITSYGYVVKNSGHTILEASIKMAFRLFEAKVELEKETENLNITLNSIGDAVIATDHEGNILRINPVAQTLTGWSLEEAAGKSSDTVFRIINAQTRLPVESPVQKVLEKGTIIGLANHTVLVAKDGTEYQIADSGSPIKDRNGNITGVVLVFRNVTEEYHKLERQRLSEERIALINNSSADSIYSFDLEGRYTSANNALCTLLSLREDEIIGKTQAELHLPEQVCRDSKRLHHEVYSTDKTVLAETGLTGLDGSPRFFEVSLNPLHDGGGTIIGIGGMTKETTKQKLAEIKLKESEAQYKRITEGITDYLYTVYLTDGKGSGTVHNEACIAITGYSPQDFRDDPYLWYNMVDPEDKDRVTTNFSKILGGANLSPIELRIKCKDGTVKWISDTSIPHLDTDGTLISYDGVIKDITERKNAEEKLNELLKEKELVLKEVHHRIKNNMNTIHSLLILQAATVSDAAAFSALEDAGSRVRSMMLLYDKLYQSADFTEIPVAQYLLSLIDEILSNFPNRKMVKIEKNIGDFVLSVKKLQPLGIIINELLTNIMKYAFIGKKEGRIAISVTCREDLVSIVIEDNGNGMPESVDFENSTGFGLVLVGGLTRQLEGTIRIVRMNGTRIILEFRK